LNKKNYDKNGKLWIESIHITYEIKVSYRLREKDQLRENA